MSTKKIQEGKRMAGVANVLRQGNLGVMAGAAGTGALAGMAAGVHPVIGAAASAVGSLAAGSGKDIARDYRSGKQNFIDQKKTRKNEPKHPAIRRSLGLPEEVQNMKENYNDIILGTLEQDPVTVKRAVEQILSAKIAEKIEDMRIAQAETMMGSEEEVGRPKVEDDEELEDLDLDDEDELLDLDDEEDPFAEVEHEEDIDLESDK